MRIEPFALERYFARHEFSVRYSLCSSDCEPLTMEEVLAVADDEVRARWRSLKLAYTVARGDPMLRAAIADLYRDDEGAAPSDPEGIVVAAPQEAIFLMMHALLEAGDHVVCVAPAYPSLSSIAASIGCDVSTWAAREDEGWAFDPDDLERLLRPTTKLVIVCFPHNPTAHLPSRRTFARIVEAVRECGATLFSDEMYRFLELDPGERLPSAWSLDDRAVTLGGLSKAFGLPGLRIGWLASKNRALLERVEMLKDYTTICNDAPSEILALAALRARAAIVGRHLATVRRNLDALDTFFTGPGGLLGWSRPRAGSIALARLPPGVEARGFCDALIREEGILLAPSSLLGLDDRHVRIGFGRENLPEVLPLFGSFLARR